MLTFYELESEPTPFRPDCRLQWLKWNQPSMYVCVCVFVGNQRIPNSKIENRPRDMNQMMLATFAHIELK